MSTEDEAEPSAALSNAYNLGRADALERVVSLLIVGGGMDMDDIERLVEARQEREQEEDGMILFLGGADDDDA